MTRLLSVCALMFAGLLPMSVVAQSPNWNGYYLGATFGGRFAVNDWTTYLTCPNSGFCGGGTPGPDYAQRFDSTALRAAAFGGRNWMLSPTWLAGLEAEIGWADNRNTNGPIPGTTASGGVPSVTTGDTASVNLSWDASVKARVGALLRPDMLLFATAGLALQRVEMVATCNNNGSNTTYCTQPPGVLHNESQTRILAGWTVGMGLEYLLAPNWLARAEYRYADFGQADPTFFTNNLGANGDDRIYAHVRVRTHTAGLGLAYKF